MGTTDLDGRGVFAGGRAGNSTDCGRAFQYGVAIWFAGQSCLSAVDGLGYYASWCHRVDVDAART